MKVIKFPAKKLTSHLEAENANSMAERMDRIKASLEKINKLMENLRNVKKGSSSDN